MEYDEHSPISALVERLTQTAINSCVKHGTLMLEEGCFSNSIFSVSIASDGGVGSVNEDFVAVFRSEKPPHEIAVAIADGVGSSLLAGAAAKLACLVSLRCLAKSQTFDRAEPIAAAQRVFRFVGKQIRSDRDAQTSNGITPHQSSAMDLQLLQTTLAVLWTEQETLKCLALADGGMVAGNQTDARFAKLAEECVGIGPFQTRIRPRALQLERQEYVGIFTDGLNELAEENDEGRSLLTGVEVPNARQAIDRILAEFPEYIDDNVSLCQLRMIRD